ncbi:LysR family transcriptional regulator [Pusillimonas sp. TS35]|uniref:LysR family transcriptional regulator n=1 Tax=Paracandidimonas lactea TaxID=2895524 RepID=UPI00136E853E|nr:LysR substrate-binding domain-containing protein [Paracandidimonas lactea]MYN12329.1 LysR family transcriptional regulator [Pusillimonas sp. TS35]
MQVKWLDDFVALANSPSLFHAAQARNVTHPAFGRRIRALEEWAGVPLLDRGPQGVALNAAGRAFLASATEILDILRDTRAALHEPAHERVRKVHFASGRTLSHSVLPPLLTRVRKAMPTFQAQVTTTSLQYGIDMLMDGRADLLLCHAHEALPEKVDTRDYAYLRVGRDKLVAVSAPLPGAHPRYRVPRGAHDAAVPFLDFAPVMSLGRILRSRLHAICPSERLDAVYESDLAEAIHAMAREGAGLAWLPLSLVRGDLENGTLVRADTASSDIDMEIRLYRARRNPKTIVRVIWEVLG